MLKLKSSSSNDINFYLFLGENVNSTYKHVQENNLCPGGGIGRHKGLKIPRRKLRAGSSPALGTSLGNYDRLF
tara:strand:+ start:106 stop:324 length:219 start_codon:yes stop_codon:yes gene_type:complete